MCRVCSVSNTTCQPWSWWSVLCLHKRLHLLKAAFPEKPWGITEHSCVVETRELYTKTRFLNIMHTQLYYISQPALQLEVAIWLNSSQWNTCSFRVWLIGISHSGPPRSFPFTVPRQINMVTFRRNLTLWVTDWRKLSVGGDHQHWTLQRKLSCMCLGHYGVSFIVEHSELYCNYYTLKAKFPG